MKLLVCIIDDFYASEVERDLREKGYRMTELASTGGFLKKGNTTFLFGVEETDLENLKAALKDACLSLEEKKKRKSKNEHRYTSFLVDASHAMPFLS
ncbi:cyclic-di-AMP receptor [Alkalihalophilus lindianensis]|uniref:Cyclic-di-AMP receptor n=1 Tax=Alkalihalophilus lindianensis TaxID=1630542 RepID=A0ABU3XDF5_9BACI|nr:cyclic-di-AMP receptor [Alkalihalophilus lindianensis]MDV2685896.1 cyclic-di-AMP receptor [Alkalihalophilus lindianensis]